MTGIYRTIEVGIWSEMWFEELEPHAKLLFLYLLTNYRQTPCGAFQVSMRSICHDTNLTTEQVSASMEALIGLDKIQWWPATGWVFVTRFYKFQRGQSSDKYTVAARKATANLPDDVRASVCRVYPDLMPQTDRVSIPSPYPTDTQSLLKQNTKTESESEDSLPRAPAHARDKPAPVRPIAFETFWKAYPRKERKPAAIRAWNRLRSPPDECDAIMAGLARWHASAQWARGIYQHPATWLNGRQWEDEPEPAHKLNGATNGQVPISREDRERERIRKAEEHGRVLSALREEITRSAKHD